jgi:hypothetical protein
MEPAQLYDPPFTDNAPKGLSMRMSSRSRGDGG